MQISCDEIITDSSILGQRFIIRNGFVFTSISKPGNVFDALVIKIPNDVRCFSPRFPDSSHTDEAHIALINSMKLQNVLIIGTDIKFLPQCPSLIRIKVIPVVTLPDSFDFSPLYQLPNIQYLFCQTNYGDGKSQNGSIDYSQINGLRQLFTASSEGIHSQVLPTLQELSVSNFNGKKSDLTDLFHSTQLEKLVMISCKNRSLNGIERYKCLQTVDLSYNRSLADISQLGAVCATLKILKIENCPKIKDFSCLEELTNLEYLELLGNNILPNLTFLKKMTRLKRFEFSMDVANGDLSPCLLIPYVHSVTDRKHFNLKNRDLPPFKAPGID